MFGLPDGMPPAFRAGVLIDFRLLGQGASADEPCNNPGIFGHPDSDFRRVFAQVRERVDARSLRKLEHDWGFLDKAASTGGSVFIGPSGGMALWLRRIWRPGAGSMGDTRPSPPGS